MIVFDLICECGFIFEGWFQDYADFVRQQESGLISCPDCERTTVRKILSPIAVHRKDRSRESSIMKSQEKIEHTQDLESAVHLLRQLQNYVERNFEDVGSELAEKSLKIHFGLEEPKNIRGVVSDDEEKMLNQEGIKLLKIPMFQKKTEDEN